MLSLLLRRVAAYAAMLVVATGVAHVVATRLLDPRVPMLRATPRPTEAAVDARLAAVGLDPRLGAAERYRDWALGVLHGDWGLSPDGTPVAPQVLSRALVSGRLALLALVLAVTVGIGLGVLAALRRHTWTDRSLTASAYALQVVPAPVLYLVVQLLGIRLDDATGLDLVAVGGISDATAPAGGWAHQVDLLRHLALPTLALTLAGAGGYLLLTRSVLLDAVGADHVRTARAKGLTRTQAVRRHALRTAAVPIAQSVAFAVPGIFAGTVVAESVFAWDGLGTYTVHAVTVAQDVNGAVAATTVGAVTFAVGALLADVAAALADPRTRRGTPA